MTPAILPSKRHHRYLKRVWCRDPTALNRSRLIEQTHLCSRQMSTAKSAHYSKLIAEHSGDHGSSWNRILHRCPEMHHSDHSCIAALANTFSSFFINIISVIRSSLPSDSHSRVLNPPDTRKTWQNTSCVTADEVSCLVLRAPWKSSDLDPIPTLLAKDCIDISIIPITSIINLLLTEVSFPLHFNSSHVSLLLKKPSFNTDSINNYRSVSNLSFLFKVLEEVVVNQINPHINSSNTYNRYQSVCRKFQYTETALLKIHNDILTPMDPGKVTAVTLSETFRCLWYHTPHYPPEKTWWLAWSYREGTQLV